MHKLALFIAWACVFQMIEFIFPSPLPGLKLGLANMISLVVLFQLGFRAALEVAIIRVLISSILVGTFLSPTFMLSLAGAITSTLVMGLLFKVSLQQNYLRLSLIGISIAGAITHTMTQLILVYFILIKHTGIFLLAPGLLIIALIMGGVTGIIARQISKDLDHDTHEVGRKEVGFLLSKAKKDNAESTMPASFLTQISPRLKIIYVCFIALTIILAENLWLYLGILIVTLSLSIAGGVPPKKLWFGIKRMRFFLILTFILDLLFINQGTILITTPWFHITQMGVDQGLLFVFRLIILLLNSYIVSLSTSPSDLALHLSRLLNPLKIFKFSTERFARILMMVWTLVPSLLSKTLDHLKPNLKNISNIRHIAKTISNLIQQSMNPIQFNQNLKVEQEQT